MGPFTANLKTLYQCPAIWFWHIVGALVLIPIHCVPLMEQEGKKGGFLGFLPITFWAGTMVASMAKDIMVKPFSFCLPAQTRVLRWVFLAVGGLVSSISVLVLLDYPGATSYEIIGVIWSGFTLGLTVYMIAVLALLKLRTTALIPGCLFVMILIVANKQFVNIRIVLEELFLGHPVENTLILGVVLAFFWRRFEGYGLARRLSEDNFLPLNSILSTGRIGAFRRREQVRKSGSRPGWIMKALEAFFLGRMEECPPESGKRFFWGSIYSTIGNGFPINPVNIIPVIILILVLTVSLGYYSPERLPKGCSLVNLILIAPCAGLVGGYPNRLFVTLLLPASRSQRFWSQVLTGLLLWVVVAIIGMMIYTVSLSMGYFFPQISIFGNTLDYTSVHPKAQFFFLLAIPFLLACWILFPRAYSIPGTIVSIFNIILFLPLYRVFTEMTILGIASVTLISWIPFLMVARYCSFFGNLVLKGE